MPHTPDTHTYNAGHLFPEVRCPYSSLSLRGMTRKTGAFYRIAKANIPTLYEVVLPDWREAEHGQES